MEIERKFTVKELPNLENIPCKKRPMRAAASVFFLNMGGIYFIIEVESA